MSTQSFLNEEDNEFLSKIDKSSNLAISLIEKTIKRQNEWQRLKENNNSEIIETLKKKDEKLVSDVIDNLKTVNNSEIIETLKKKDEKLLSDVIDNLKTMMYQRESLLNSIRKNRLERGDDAKNLGSSNGGKKMRKTRKTMRKRNKKRRSFIRSH